MRSNKTDGEKYVNSLYEMVFGWINNYPFGCVFNPVIGINMSKDLGEKESSWDCENAMKRYYMADRDGWLAIYNKDMKTSARVIVALLPFALYGMVKSVVWLTEWVIHHVHIN